MRKNLWIICGILYVVLGYWGLNLSNGVTFQSPRLYLNVIPHVFAFPEIFRVLQDFLIVGFAYIPVIGPLIFSALLTLIFFMVGALLGRIIEISLDNRILLYVLLPVCLFGFGFRFTEYKLINFPRVPEDCLKHNSNYGRLNQQYCLIELAKKLRDVKICLLVGSEDQKSNCFSIFATEILKDYATCELVPSKQAKEECISRVAYLKGDCARNSEGYGRDACYSWRASDIRVAARDKRCNQERENSEIKYELCRKFENGQISIKDLCQEINDPIMRNHCLTYDISGTTVIYND